MIDLHLLIYSAVHKEHQLSMAQVLLNISLLLFLRFESSWKEKTPLLKTIAHSHCLAR